MLYQDWQQSIEEDQQAIQNNRNSITKDFDNRIEEEYQALYQYMISRGSEVGYTPVNLQKSKLEFEYSAKGRQRMVVCRETDPTTGRKVRHVVEFYRKNWGEMNFVIIPGMMKMSSRIRYSTM